VRVFARQPAFSSPREGVAGEERDVKQKTKSKEKKEEKIFGG
jgi:hypothetical protein